MADPELRGWLRERRPEVPPPLLESMVEEGEDQPPDAPGLAELGVRALIRALEAPGAVRTSAFHLLAGDALITYACELLARSPDPLRELENLLRSLGERLHAGHP